MHEDAELLRRYAEDRSEEAFAELVERRIGLVYSVAFRRTRDAHHAQDVTQVVFTALARKAAVLAQRPVLVGWLYRSAHYAATDVIRAERSRTAREQEAHLMNEFLAYEEPQPDWENVRPVLDDAMTELDERDRDAILLRYFDGRAFAEIGARLQLTENAARMRVERAAEKLRHRLAGRGITSTTAALAAALGSQAMVAAPATLAATVTGAALAGGAVGIGGGSAVAAGTFFLMNKSVILVGMIVVAAIGTTVYHVDQAHRAAASVSILTQERSALQAQLRDAQRKTAAVAQQLAATEAQKRLSEVEPKLQQTEAPKAPTVAKADRAAPTAFATTADKLAALKPQLEAGMPIKGAVVFLVDGKPVQQQVAFMIGKETRMDAGDDGIYLVTPTLRADGAVRYNIKLKKNADAEAEQLPVMIILPWKGFTMGGGRTGRALAFDSDLPEP